MNMILPKLGRCVGYVKIERDLSLKVDLAPIRYRNGEFVWFTVQCLDLE